MNSEHELLVRVLEMKAQVPLALDLNQCALLVIDMQRNFVDPEYEFAQTFERLAPGLTKGILSACSRP